MHLASKEGLAGAVARLLSHGADAALTGEVRMPLDLAGNDEVKAAFAEHAERIAITEDNKNWLLLVCARHMHA